jgi:hypothetical protein
VIVDTTPHAVVAALAGKPFPHPQVYTGTHPRVSGVNIDRLIEYIVENPEDVDVQGPINSSPDLLRELVSKDMALIMRGFGRARDLAISGDPAYSITGHGEPPFLTFFYDGDGCGTYWIRPSEHRYTQLDDPEHLSNTLCALRRAQWLTHRLFRDFVPGFEHAHLVDIYPHIARALIRSHEPSGFTEFDIPKEHIVNDGELYEDSIARVMGHPDAGQSPSGFQVPLRSLIPRDLGSLLVTGKPACRFLHYHGTNAAVGHAAGVVAAISAVGDTVLRKLEVGKVQDELVRQGAVIF